MSFMGQKKSPEGCLGENMAQGKNGYHRCLQETGITAATN